MKKNLLTEFSSKILTVALLTSTLFFTSCGEDGVNPEIPGVIGPKLTVQADFVRIDTVFENLQIAGGGRISFAALGLPEYPNSFIELGPDLQSSGTLFVVSLNLQDILWGDEGIGHLDPRALPDGRPLPGVVGGRLPSIAFDVEKFNDMGFYIGKRVFGIWYPMSTMNIGINNIITMRFYSDGVRAGNISMVGPSENGKGAGLLLMVDFGPKTKKYLKKYYKKWKRKNK